MVRIAVTGEAHVHYSQIYVVGEGMYPDLFASMRGQRNGLCGAAEPGMLFLITGLHTGSVGFTVEVHDEPPLLDDAWEDVVEASFRPLGGTFLMAWAAILAGGARTGPGRQTDQRDRRLLARCRRRATAGTHSWRACRGRPT